MERSKIDDPLDVLPDVLLSSIAHREGISRTGVEGSAKRLGVMVSRTATGRGSVTPRDAVLIIEELQAKRVARS